MLGLQAFDHGQERRAVPGCDLTEDQAVKDKRINGHSLPGVRNEGIDAEGGEVAAVDRSLHKVACSQNGETFQSAVMGLRGNNLRDMEPRKNGLHVEMIESLMDGVIRTDDKIGAE